MNTSINLYYCECIPVQVEIGHRLKSIQACILLGIKTKTLLLDHNKIVTIHSKAFWSSASNNKTTHTELTGVMLTDNKLKYIGRDVTH